MISERVPLIHSYYVCDCGQQSCNMSLDQNKRHEPTSDELTERPDMEPIAHEVLICPCGIEHTWFSLHQISRQFREPISVLERAYLTICKTLSV